MHTSIVLLVILVALAVCGATEYVRHQRRVRTIPIRVHVNGTRGKSSVTRLIGAGLRAGGIRTLTKVTGTYPRIILDDGNDVHIHRRGDPNIIEQLSVVKFAAERNVAALVVECMALDRQYQRITERQMVHATVGVITNIRMDHIDIMGRTLPEITAVLAETIPEKGILFSAEEHLASLLQEHCDRRRATLVTSRESAVPQDDMQGFGYIEHRENVALALAVCAHLGVDRDTALRGMYAATPDAGVLRRHVVHAFGKRLAFYNAFAANDPDSTWLVWRRLRDEVGLDGCRIVLLNTRQDRMDRARQLAALAGHRLHADIDYLMLIGQCPEVVRGMAMGYGVPAGKILSVGWTTPETVFEKLLEVTGQSSSIVAIGNMGGMGGSVADYFEHRSLHDRTCDYAGTGPQPVVV